MSTNVTPYQLNLLHHTLGLRPDRREPYRNHFVAGPEHDDLADLEALVSVGLMARSPTPKFCNPTDMVFHVTEAGEVYAINNLPPAPPPPKRSKYGDWLDADTGFSFRDYLLGDNAPEYEGAWREGTGTGRSCWHWRMYRRESPCWQNPRIEGEWKPTKKEAKASYKAALKAQRGKGGE
ncbi:hypothetical protein N8I74_15850 [Chitiniphilus purpureus]|uniref:Uncharacterized protein n=1 Tax=Chitiniphilus purpureus TaxID=2981137 RepID=A0ABY6DL58_9NEIS|nr:hypothetical protein [Chitiniphilus sp. CD1]UXY14777.1 hypothetical protein N8I74_15850 [Chitiniphilus sp. CD1]